jgi:hypothetical protein
MNCRAGDGSIPVELSEGADEHPNASQFGEIWVPEFGPVPTFGSHIWHTSTSTNMTHDPDESRWVQGIYDLGRMSNIFGSNCQFF